MSHLSKIFDACAGEPLLYRLAGYYYGLTGVVDGISEEQAAEKFLASHPPGKEEHLAQEAFRRGVLDAVVGIQADEEAHYVSVAEAAVIKDVSKQAVRDVLRDEERRKAIFPRARFHGDSPRRGAWKLHEDDVEAWKPRKSREKS